MAFLPLFHNSVVLSNGKDFSYIQSGHRATLKGVPCLIGCQLDTEDSEQCMNDMLLVETHYLGDEREDFAELIKALQNALDSVTPFTKLVGVRESIEYFVRTGGERIKRETRHKEFLVKVSLLEEEYKHLHPDLISMVKSFDHYYAYSDDINVYRRGVEREKVIKEELAKVDALAFFTRYKALL